MHYCLVYLRIIFSSFAVRMKDAIVQIIYEDNHLIAANKPCGMLSQGDETGDWTLIDEVKKYLRWKYQKPGDAFLGSFHRLDRPSSGVVVFAKTSKALTRMNELMRDRKIEKEYLICVEGRTPQDSETLTHYMAKDEKKNISKAYDLDNKGRKIATLKYEMLAYADQVGLCKINLETGRSHQIRVQMAKIGNCVVGDKKYGATRKMDRESIALHCQKMSFIHPVKKEPIEIIANVLNAYPWNIFSEYIKEFNKKK
jgi:23S rRNA pseudouridine1911/1915/1917 synthase